jgi:hypothetical protein
MAREDLKPFNTLTEEEQKRIATNGGTASGVARRKKKEVKQIIEALFNCDAPDKLVQKFQAMFPNVEIKTIEELVNLSVIKEVLKGNIFAYNSLYDRKDGRPKNNLDITTKGDKINDIGDEKRADLSKVLLTHGLINEDQCNGLKSSQTKTLDEKPAD